jgi:hypothetical protein
MSSTPSNMHSEAALNRRLVLFAGQLETYITHFPNCHKYALTQTIRSDARRGRLASVISRIAMTLRTKSFHHVINHIHETNHALFDRLPQSHRRHHHPHLAPATA